MIKEEAVKRGIVNKPTTTLSKQQSINLLIEALEDERVSNRIKKALSVIVIDYVDDKFKEACKSIRVDSVNSDGTLNLTLNLID